MKKLKLTGRGFLIGYGVLVFAGLIFLLVRSMGPSGTPVQPPVDDSSDSSSTASVESYLESGTVTLQNSSSLGDSVSKSRLERTQNIIYVKVANSLVKPASQYSGIIREGSIKKSTSASGTPAVDFLVDISEIKRTYHISINGNDDSEFKAIYVLCPTAAELTYPAFECSDG